LDNLHQNIANDNKGGYVIPTIRCNMLRIFKGKKIPYGTALSAHETVGPGGG